MKTQQVQMSRRVIGCSPTIAATAGQKKIGFLSAKLEDDLGNATGVGNLPRLVFSRQRDRFLLAKNKLVFVGYVLCGAAVEDRVGRIHPRQRRS